MGCSQREAPSHGASPGSTERRAWWPAFTRVRRLLRSRRSHSPRDIWNLARLHVLLVDSPRLLAFSGRILPGVGGGRSFCSCCMFALPTASIAHVDCCCHPRDALVHRHHRVIFRVLRASIRDVQYRRRAASSRKHWRSRPESSQPTPVHLGPWRGRRRVCQLFGRLYLLFDGSPDTSSGRELQDGQPVQYQGDTRPTDLRLGCGAHLARANTWNQLFGPRLISAWQGNTEVHDAYVYYTYVQSRSITFNTVQQI